MLKTLLSIAILLNLLSVKLHGEEELESGSFMYRTMESLVLKRIYPMINLIPLKTEECRLYLNDEEIQVRTSLGGCMWDHYFLKKPEESYVLATGKLYSGEEVTIKISRTPAGMTLWTDLIGLTDNLDQFVEDWKIDFLSPSNASAMMIDSFMEYRPEYLQLQKERCLKEAENRAYLSSLQVAYVPTSIGFMPSVLKQRKLLMQAEEKAKCKNSSDAMLIYILTALKGTEFNHLRFGIIPHNDEFHKLMVGIKNESFEYFIPAIYTNFFYKKGKGVLYTNREELVND